MSELDDVKAHRDLLVRKLDTILSEFEQFRKDIAADKIEYNNRNKRDKRVKLTLGTVVLLFAILGVTNYNTATTASQTAIDLKAFVECQARFNDTVNRSAKVRSEAAQVYTASTLEYGRVRNDPTSTPEEIDRARGQYFKSLQNQAEAQAKNQIPLASPCRLGD